MAQCPRCNREYADEEGNCPDCGAVQADDSDAQTAAASKPAFFVSVPTGMEAELLKARLESAHIPFYIRPHRGKGLLRVYMGPSNLGADFYVPQARLEEAKVAICLEDMEGAATQGPEDEPPVETPTEQEKTPGQKLWLNILTILAISLALLAFFSFDALLQFIRKLMGM